MTYNELTAGLDSRGTLEKYLATDRFSITQPRAVVNRVLTFLGRNFGSMPAESNAVNNFLWLSRNSDFPVEEIAVRYPGWTFEVEDFLFDIFEGCQG